MVEGTGLENQRGRPSSVGSNPTPSAKFRSKEFPIDPQARVVRAFLCNLSSIAFQGVPLLTDTVIRNAKPGEKPLKLFDGKGLFLLVNKTRGKLWRLGSVTD